MKTIVVGYDGSRVSERALMRAADLATAFGAHVVVVIVVPADLYAAGLPVGAFGLAPIDYPTTEEAPEDLWTAHHAHARALLEARGVACEFVSQVGGAADALAGLADEPRTDLIVMGTHGPRCLERLFAGSVSQGVARRAHGDVLIVRPGHEGRSTPASA